LTDIKLPANVQEIKSHAFYGTGYYNNPDNWDNNVLYIDNYLIQGNEKLSGNYTIKDGTTLIANWAFTKNKNLTSVIMPDSVKYLGKGLFKHCDALKSVRLSNNVLHIKEGLFRDCFSL
jgi:hypothetical protein